MTLPIPTLPGTGTIGWMSPFTRSQELAVGQAGLWGKNRAVDKKRSMPGDKRILGLPYLTVSKTKDVEKPKNDLPHILEFECICNQHGAVIVEWLVPCVVYSTKSRTVLFFITSSTCRPFQTYRTHCSVTYYFSNFFTETKICNHLSIHTATWKS